ncbi:Cof-type HAD-IIB family hydrolase [Salinicoccus jeotgali]|uniref:Cof-type HAD-IIB family hydrolase n=1 Tax=Salinicoccus jeotgali TaxID=381634 RepID=A0ABP7F294_9STAP
MVKLIALDMDGTLLTPHHDISRRNMEAINEAMKRGIQVVVATGRAFYEAHGIIRQLNTPLPYICLNGAEVRNESHEILATNALNAELVHKVADVFRSEDIFYQIYTDRAIYTADVERDIQIFMELAGEENNPASEKRIRGFMEERLKSGTLVETDDYRTIFENEEENILKLLASSPSKPKLFRARNELYDIGNLAVSSSSEGNIELTHENAQKGIALTDIANIMNIDMKDVMAVGDNLNDISMLKRVGMAVAMGNAASEVKAIADKVTESNTEDGVAIAIEEALDLLEEKQEAQAGDLSES